MHSGPAEITHVSDTALMTAGCRALETERADGLTRDPFAARLAGERGMAIARSVPDSQLMSFGMGVRTRFLDDLVMETIAGHGIHTVRNLGAGLDTRPWRLALPGGLRWIEVDLPRMIEYKSAIMADVTPQCELHSMAADVTDAVARDAIFAAAGQEPVLLITEGLLMYLPAAAVEGLAAQHSGAHHWLMDITSPGMAARTRLTNNQAIEAVRAASHLDGLQTIAVLNDCGWHSAIHRNYGKDAWPFAAERINQLLRQRDDATPVPAAMPADDPSGVHLFVR